MNCKKVQFLMCLYIADDPALTAKERLAFTHHLRNCQECAREYEESKFVIDLARDYWQVSEDTLSLIEKANEHVKPQMTVEEGCEDLERRIPELVRLVKHQKRLQLFNRGGVVAACLIIGISIILTFSYYSRPEIAQKPVPEQVASIPKPSIKIELASKNGNLHIPADHKITVAEGLEILIIKEKHRMVMNSNTTLSIEPLVENNRMGCMVKLTSGEILANVEHDGNPFVVSTAHGKAVITGTTFDVKVTDASTTLVVIEGTVQFESEKGVVKVAAGQISEIVARSAPTKPVSCNTTEKTAWATGQRIKSALARIGPYPDTYDLTDLWLSAISGPIELEAIDYDNWVEEKRAWFKREFPWIFQLKDALAKEGIEVDYPKFLIKSGDIWQFMCLEERFARFSVTDLNSLLKTVVDYGFDKQWLLENFSVTKYAMERTVSAKDYPTGLKAFEQWLKYLDETGDLKPPTPLYSFHASKYLANTRSLIWFAINAGEFNMTGKQRIEVLDLLQQEVTAATNCCNDLLYIVDEQKKSICDEDLRETLKTKITEYIKTVKTIEEKTLNIKLVDEQSLGF